MPDRAGRTPLALLRFSGGRPVKILLALSAVLLLASLLAAFVAVGQVSKANEQVEHTLRVEASINRLATLNEQIETARRGQLLAPEASFVRLLQSTQVAFDNEIAELTSLVADNPGQLERVAEIRALHSERAPLITDTILTPANALNAILETGIARDRGTQITRTIRAMSATMSRDEEDLLFARNANQSRSTGQLYMIGGLTTALLIAFLGAVIVLVLRYNRDLTLAQAALQRSNEGLEEAVAARTAELVRANGEIQRFAYIVSHDLRSPLVNVLGFTAELDGARKTIRSFLETLFAELPDRREEDVWLAVDEDLPEALDFIRKSTEKMDRLINSILELSRQGRRQLNPVQLDMNALVDGVVSSLHQRAEDAGAEVVVEPIPPFQSDRVAVEQIVSNLAENALKYLDPKRPGRVTISGTRQAGTVRITVADNGRGIAEADHERVFELFRRAGTQDQPGEGIGLANVRALAYRLGGTITLESQLDEGSIFTLSLPEKFIAVETIA
jgi:signal transduction histidine kinase